MASSTTQRSSLRRPPMSYPRAGSRPGSPVLDRHERMSTEDNDPEPPVQVRDNASEMLEEVIMALHIQDRDTLGCAYFDTKDRKLSISETIPVAEIDFAHQLMMQIQPSTVIVSGRAPEPLLKLVETRCQTTDAPTMSDVPILHLVSTADFSFEAAIDRICNLESHIEGAGPSRTSRDASMLRTMGSEGHGDGGLAYESSTRLLRCKTTINFESRVSIQCAGAVISELHRRRSVSSLPDGLVTIDAFTILQTEMHPNGQGWGPSSNAMNSKESLSVYGLFHRFASTPQGKLYLKRIFLRPTLDIDTIVERQRTISALLRPDNADTIKRARVILSKMGNVRTVISLLKRGVQTGTAGRSYGKGPWGSLLRFSEQGLRLKEAVQSLRDSRDCEIARLVIDNISSYELLQVGKGISSTIDFEQSESRGRTSVKSGVSARLDELKRQYDGMGSFLTKAIDTIQSTLPTWARRDVKSCIFLPQLGFLTVVDSGAAAAPPTFENYESLLEDWNLVFKTEETSCYKNKFMRELDAEYGDAYCEIGDAEVEIVHQLTLSILQYESQIVEASDICGHFDALLALAFGAEQYQWTLPEMREESILFIKGGRHPLQELVVPVFVPNDCVLASDVSPDDVNTAPRILVLTGPNHSGKSVYLKQTAIIVYLAHIGSFVPAEEAVIGLTDKILTRISTRETASLGESAFSVDLQQIAHGINCATNRSLVVVDEFGKGTCADDGAGLLAALIDHYVKLEQQSPRLLLATHFHEVFELQSFDTWRGVALANMEVYMEDEHSQEITYLFKLRPGYCSTSFGARCAALNGVPEAIVERAEELGRLLARHEDLSAACARLFPEEEAKLEHAEAVSRNFLQGYGADYGISSLATEEGYRNMLKTLLAPAAGG